MEKIKIGRKEFDVKKGDYILDNGLCFQFCTGDGRVLLRKGFNSYTSLLVPASMMKKINLSTLAAKPYQVHGMNLIRYYF